MRALFAVSRVLQPSVIFIDEIDSLLSQRADGEQDASRRMKTEFLIQLDGAGCDPNDRILVIGATNRPQEIDEAARRRLVKRLYIGLPDAKARKELIVGLLNKYGHENSLSESEVDTLVERADGKQNTLGGVASR